MRARGFALSVAALATMLSAPVAFAGASVAEPELLKSVGRQLPVTDLRAIELDERRGRLYIAQGAGSTLPLVVTDLDGALLTEVPAVTGASDVVMSDDGDTLLVTQDFDHVTAVAADSLVPTARYDAPAGACVYSAEPAVGKIVGAFRDCGIGSGGLLVWSAPGVPPVVFTDGPDYRPLLSSSPGGGLIVAGDTGYSPVRTHVIDVSGATPIVVTTNEDTGSGLNDYALSPDGTEVVVSVGAPYAHHSYSMPDLSAATTYPSGTYPVDAAWSGDGSTLVVARSSIASTEADVLFYAKGSTTSTYAVAFRHPDELWKGTLLVNSTGTRAWAVSYDDVDQERQLLHSFGPAHPPTAPYTDIAISARKGTGKDKSTAFVTVTWTSPISRPYAQQFLQVYASTDGAAPRMFGSTELTAAGSYTAKYPLPRGTTTFTAPYTDSEDFYPAAAPSTTLTR